MSSNDDTIFDPAGQAVRMRVRQDIARLQARLQTAGIDFRAPPPEPDSCCGRGCHGCVWEGYESALAWWYEEAGALLAP